MKIEKISLLRRILQVFFLVLLVYGGYVFKKEYKEVKAAKTAAENSSFFPAPKAPDGSVSTTKFEKGSILWPSGDTPVLENYPPGLICRFNPNGGMFKACIVHFFSENLTWRTAVKYWLPHLTLFILLCLLLGRMWCGWWCPIGAVGDFLSWIRRKMNVPVKRFPKSFRHLLRGSSYGLLGSALSISAVIGLPNYARFQCYWFLPYCQICPARLICPLFGLIKPNLKDFSTAVSSTFTILAWLFLGIFVAAFYWGRRVWCHLCPVGLMNSWFNKGSMVELRKTAVRCNKCASCADACPMGLTKMYEADENIIYNQQGCIMCLRCIEVCPKEKCLSMRFMGKKITESKS